jgi:hypothetical protein
MVLFAYLFAAIACGMVFLIVITAIAAPHAAMSFFAGVGASVLVARLMPLVKRRGHVFPIF